MTQKLLEWFFTAIYFVLWFYLVKYCFDLAPVNFVFDLLAIVVLLIGFVLSAVLADKTVRKIKETL